MNGLCDKCGKPVDPKNDAVTLDLYLGIVHSLFAQPRHLLPTDDCVGSRSRAQYITGVLDTRPEYALDPSQVALVRAAYQRMQEE